MVDADGITIDLDGHTLDGKGLGAGVRNVGFDNVTIKNGRVVDFDWGVALNTGTRRNVIENMRPEMAQEAGVRLGHIAEPDPTLPVEPPDPFPSADSGVRENIIRDNTVIGNKRGVWLTGNTQGTLVKDNASSPPRATTRSGSSARTTTGWRRTRSTARAAPACCSRARPTTRSPTTRWRCNNAGVVLDVTHTPPVDVQSNDNRVERNLIEESGGLEIIESDRNELIENVVRRANDSAVSLEFARDNVVRGNDLRTNKSGIYLKSSTGNRLEAQRRQRLREHGHLARVAVLRQRADPQPVQQQRRRGHLRRRRGARRHRDADRGQHGRTTTRASASTSPSRAT